jgi:hypothetical protein
LREGKEGKATSETGSKQTGTWDITVDLICNGPPEGMNDEFSVVSSVKNNPLEVIPKDRVV